MDFARHTLQWLDALLARLSTTLLPVPPPLREHPGTLARRPVTFRARAWSAPQLGRLRSYTVTDAQDAPCLVEAALYPAPDTAGPILGLDLFCMGPKIVVLVLDLVPTSADAPGHDLAQRFSDLQTIPPPPWYQRLGTSHAVLYRDSSDPPPCAPPPPRRLPRRLRRSLPPAHRRRRPRRPRPHDRPLRRRPP